jgi:tetratricopeptide (TPR) repeat protein
VLVLQNLGLTVRPTWHYAVVVGYLADEKQFVLRSGAHARLLVSRRRFAHTWMRGQRWALVALRPGELPARADARRYLQSVAAVESVGDFDTAIAGYRSATDRWPHNETAWLGLGNALYGKGDLKYAGDAYRRSLALQPGSAITLNNLSQVYLELGCRTEALATIDAALSGASPQDPFYPDLLETRKSAEDLGQSAQCL